ncbi:hypothetical protein CfE428DRAFT_2336 [Chthoniobacter flavus Ellin428]|uniref:DUF2934 domain-containing protein n=1 Tax=Chthoniobacter flavus Ellin428 TaxID=497964 RepID=B4D098_9BACT|nr:DUF2934 domain-containing protein [Chthoniobacter flavus]EDY20412.1 hypothetical protein CfE428DRAFT_2336 [Chthoniobacter flavus Ellin428]TCO94300.1 DUF2934 family protein [Chthoniobacter flavus]
MPKKTDSTPKSVAPAAATPEVSTPAPAPVKRAIKAAPKTKNGVKKPKAPAAKAKRTTKITAPKVSSFTREDVALRAYFISEKRRHHGIPGDEHQDWLEAERQLLTESAKPRKAKKGA